MLPCPATNPLQCRDRRNLRTLGENDQAESGWRPRMKWPDRSHPAPINQRKRLVVVVLWKLLPCDAVDHGTGVGDDDLKFVPSVIDHEKRVNR